MQQGAAVRNRTSISTNQSLLAIDFDRVFFLVDRRLDLEDVFIDVLNEKNKGCNTAAHSDAGQKFERHLQSPAKITAVFVFVHAPAVF